MPRKIIQVCAYAESFNRYGSIWVLCDDGSVWVQVMKEGSPWHKQDTSAITESDEDKTQGELPLEAPRA